MRNEVHQSMDTAPVAGEPPIRTRLQDSETKVVESGGLSAECAKSVNRLHYNVKSQISLTNHVHLCSTIAISLTALLGIGSFILQVIYSWRLQ
jgi:hypothetical protein